MDADSLIMWGKQAQKGRGAIKGDGWRTEDCDERQRDELYTTAI
jgi:hypothetical protein